MSRRVPFTTTLPAEIVDELAHATKETGMKKNAILVEAFTLWNRKRKQQMLAASYARMQLPDPDSIST